MAACGSEVALIVPPPPPPGELSLRLVPDPEDAGFAQALGWGAAIPSATVTVASYDPGQPLRTFQSESDGTVRLNGLTRGDYRVEVRRPLNGSERGRAGGGVVGWFAGEARRLESGVTPIAVAALASRRGTLVISEWSFNSAFPAGQNAYHDHSYLELYNASDATIFLDGMILGRGFVMGYDFPTISCNAVADFANDSIGVWSDIQQRFPGRGQDHPVLPGQTVLVATDAIDHRPFGGPGTVDLSDADFELVAVTDVDNPAVPNLIDVGPRAATLHGIVWNPLWSAVFIARPTDLTTLVSRRPPTASVDYRRFPTSQLLDLVSYFTSWTGNPYPACPRLLHPHLDRAPATGMGQDEHADVSYSLQRIRLETAPVVLLQDTRNSAIDFVRALRTPGVP